MPTHKADLVKQLAEEHGLSAHKTGQVIQGFLDQISETLAREQRLELRGFGVFHVSTQPGRTVHHPTTQEPYPLPPTQAVDFRAGKQLKARLNPKPTPKKSKKAKQKPGAKKVLS